LELTNKYVGAANTGHQAPGIFSLVRLTRDIFRGFRLAHEMHHKSRRYGAQGYKSTPN
jgi:hypothetical protein